MLIAKSYLLTKHSYEKACKAELIKTINFSINHFKEKIHTKVRRQFNFFKNYPSNF